MNHLSWKRSALLLLLAFTLVSVGCSKKVAAPPQPPPPPVVPPPAPTVTLSADRTTLTAGQSAVLTYSSTNAATVTISGGVGAVQPAAGGTRQVTPTATTSFTATATGPGGNATSAAVNITVNPVPPPAPTVSLSADRTTLTVGQSATLTYSSTNATTVTISGGVGAVQPAAGGTRQVTPNATTTFTATATGPGGTITSTAVNITVNPAPKPPGPTLDQLFTQTMVPILFDFDKYNIRPDQESKLLNIASWLKQNPTVRFTIEGHADERGSQEYNIALSDERANSTLKYLTGQGIAATRMTTVPYGEERPICREQNEDCWQRNRRAAFVRIP